MITKSKLAIVATLAAANFATPAFAQSFAFSGAESTALSAYYNRGPSYWDYAPTIRKKQTVVYDGYHAHAQFSGSQNIWTSAAALGNQR
jgi:hypothetical protein